MGANMRRPEVTKLCNEYLEQLGIKPHQIGLKQVSPSLELSIVAGGQVLVKKLRSGLTRNELMIALEDVERFVNEKTGTQDLEERLKELA